MEIKLTIEAPIVEISQKDSTTKEITMLVHKLDIANGNGLDFKEEYTVQYMNTLINKPVVTAYYPLNDDLGDHEPVFDENGRIIELRTIAIGTIKDVWIANYQASETEIVKALFAKAVVWSYKYPQIMSCIEKLFNSNKSTSSVEVEIYQYGPNPTQQYRYATNYSYLGNCLLGSTVTPADSDAGVISVFQKEVAMAVKQDLALNKSLEGGEEMASKTNELEKVLFNKGFETKYHGEVQIAELSYGDIRDQIYNLINPTNPQTEEREYNFWIRDLFQTYVILEDWNNSSLMFKVNYSINNNVVSLDAKESWVQVELTYQPIGTNIAQLLEDREREISEINEQHKKEGVKVEEQVKELESKVSELSNKIQELEGTIVAQQEKITEKEQEVAELNSKVEELIPYKEKYETAQKEVKAKELSEKYSKVLKAEVFSSERVQNAIKEGNEVELNSIVAEEVLKEVVNKQQETKDETVIVTASKNEDLLPTNKRDYWYSKKSE